MNSQTVSSTSGSDDSAYLGQIVELLQRNKTQILANWRRDARLLASARQLDIPTLDDHIPAFLEELIKILAAEEGKRVGQVHATGSPPAHGLQRLEDGFDVNEVVTEYNILRDVLQDVVESQGLTLHGRASRIINWVLDSAIGLAVETYAKYQAVELQKRREEHLAFIVHDLRTPLQALVLASLELEAATQTAQSNDTDEILDVLKRNLGRLNILVSKVSEEQINMMSGGGHKLVQRPIDLAPLVKNLIRDIRPLCESGDVRIISSIPGDLVVYADAPMLTQIFQNLVSNAIRFSPGGEINVGARRVEGRIECWVQDNGDGIPADRIDRIFDILETDPDPKKSGTGLGLAIVKQAVEAHGGKIIVESQDQKGTTFRFTLPVEKPV